MTPAPTVEVQDTRVFSSGLGASDVELQVVDPTWIGDGIALIRTIVRYVESSQRTLKPGETFGYGFWLVRFDHGADRLSISEYASDVTDFVPGADLALRLWREQHEVCDQAGAAFTPPQADQIVATSAGVYEGDAVQGVRYEAPDNMSGWYLTTDRFDGDVTTLHVEHLYHVLDQRPDLSSYVALPAGFRFDTTNGRAEVWFDEQVAAS